MLPCRPTSISPFEPLAVTVRFCRAPRQYSTDHTDSEPTDTSSSRIIRAGGERENTLAENRQLGNGEALKLDPGGVTATNQEVNRRLRRRIPTSGLHWPLIC